MRILRLVALSVILCVSGIGLFAHDDVENQIRQVTSEIANKPNDPELYLKRGELYRAREDWRRARADYDRAIRFRSNFPAPYLCHAIVALEMKEASQAKKWADRFLELQGPHSKGFLIRARAYAQLNQVDAALSDYDASLINNPNVDIFVERSQFLATKGRIEDALSRLDEGINALGPLVTLQTMALDLEIEKKNYERALERLESILKQAERKERWLARRAEILLASGNLDGARQSYSEALLALQALPESRRSTPAMQELEKQIQSGLKTAEK